MQTLAVGSWTVLAEIKGAALENLSLQHPFYDRRVPVILGDHVTLDAGTGAVHTAPGHGLEDYIVGPPLRSRGRQPGGRRRQISRLHAAVRRRGGVRRQRARHRGAANRTDDCSKPSRTSRLSALLAPQDAGDLSRHPAVVHQHGPGGTAQERARGDSARRLDARLGRAAHHRHDRGPARLVRVAAAHLGRAHPAVRRQGVGRAASAHRRADRGRGQAGGARKASMPGSISIPSNCSAPRPRSTTSPPTSWTCGSIRGSRTTASLRCARRSPRRRICISRVRISTAAGSTAHC